jgi:hypothetical protein
VARAGASHSIAARRRPAIPLKPAYGPTMGALLAPRWRAARRWVRWSVLALGAALGAGLLAAVLSLQSPSASHGGAVPFSFSYKGLYRTTPEAGGFIRVERRDARGLLDSFAVAPLRIPPYKGSVSGAFPLYAATYVPSLAARLKGFTLVGEGPVRTSAFGSWEELPPSTVYYHVPTYTIAFRARVEGEPVLGREIWLVPNRQGAQDGVSILMLAAARGRAGSASPISLGTTGPLAGALRSFRLGG